MTPKRLRKLRRELDGFRTKLGSLTARELESVALTLGRTRANRGKEPTYVSDRPGWFPLSIPQHPGTLKRGTASNIVSQLEHDLDRLEELIVDAQEDGDPEQEHDLEEQDED